MLQRPTAEKLRPRLQPSLSEISERDPPRTATIGNTAYGRAESALHCAPSQARREPHARHLFGIVVPGRKNNLFLVAGPSERRINSHVTQQVAALLRWAPQRVGLPPSGYVSIFEETSQKAEH